MKFHTDANATFALNSRDSDTAKSANAMATPANEPIEKTEKGTGPPPTASKVDEKYFAK
jgi:hypothetical protein